MVPPLSLVQKFNTHRLIPTRFAQTEDSVLAAVAHDDAHLRDLFDLENATNQRLIAENNGMPGIGVDELVFGVPNFRVMNAAFSYAHPEGSRFNGPDRGAWYCAFEHQTALAEIVFHKTVEYTEIDYFDDEVTYQTLLADFNAEFHDLRLGKQFLPCLNPDSYRHSQEMGLQLLKEDSLGIVYPSVRRPSGTNLVCFRPALVGHVRYGECYTLRWEGKPDPKVKKIKA